MRNLFTSFVTIPVKEKVLNLGKLKLAIEIDLYFKSG